jgi:hypothetical protein
MLVIRAPYPDAATGGTARNKTMGDIPGLIGYHTVLDPAFFTLGSSNDLVQWKAKQGSTILNQSDATKRLTYSASVAAIGDKPAFTFPTGARMDFADASGFPADTTGHTILLLYRGTVTKSNLIIVSWGSATGKWRIAGYGNSATNTWAANSIGDHSSTNSALNTTALMVHTLASGANPISTHFVNGGAGQTKAFTGSVAQGATSASIGYTSFYTNFDAQGVILQALAVYTGELSTANRQDAEGIMAWEHGQQGLLTGGPYMTTRPTITAANDNIAFLRQSVQRRIYLPSRRAA